MQQTKTRLISFVTIRNLLYKTKATDVNEFQKNTCQNYNFSYGLMKTEVKTIMTSHEKCVKYNLGVPLKKHALYIFLMRQKEPSRGVLPK